MIKWTRKHAKLIGRIIFADLLEYPIQKYKSFIENVERKFSNAERGARILLRPSGYGGQDAEGNRRKGAEISPPRRGARLVRHSPKGDGGRAWWVTVRRLSKARTLEEKENASVAVVAKIETRLRQGYGVARNQGRGNKFTIRYACEGFNKMYVVDSAFRDELCADSDIRSVLFRLRRISSRNALTHGILRGIIEHQADFLRTGNPIDLVPLSQVQLTEWMNRGEGYVKERKAIRLSGDPELGDPGIRRSGCPSPGFPGSRMTLNDGRTPIICNSWISRLVNRLSVITPSGEEKPLKWFFQTQKDINKRLIKQLLDKENDDLESRKLKKPYTDNELTTKLETLLRERAKQRFTPRVSRGKLHACPAKCGASRFTDYSLSRHSVGHCRKDMGIPPAKRRLSGYKYPPLSANFSMLYPLVLEEVLKNAPSSPGIYEFRVKGREIEYPNGKTQVIYIGSTRDIKKRLREHLGKNSKNGHIRGFLKSHDCSFRYIQFPNEWKREEKRLYDLFVTTYGASPRCNRVKP